MKNDKCEWLYTDYESGLTEDDWLRLLNEKDIFNENSLIVMACMKDNGGGATCAQLAAKYGRHFGFYNMTSSKLAKRVAKKLNVRFRMIIMQNIGLFFILADILKKAN